VEEEELCVKPGRHQVVNYVLFAVDVEEDQTFHLQHQHAVTMYVMVLFLEALQHREMDKMLPRLVDGEVEVVL
jgi:hypothetical protein